MDTLLLAWNPNRWNWTEIGDDCERVRRSGVCRARWSCGRRKNIALGSRFFLIRLGVEPKGILGAGRILSSPFEDTHWDSAREAAGETGWFVSIEFDSLSIKPLISWDELHVAPLDGVHWATQMSGVTIPAPQAASLEDRWRMVDPAYEVAAPEELLDAYEFWEGASRKIPVNIYERDRSARLACIAHYGARCCVCAFDFERVYGVVAASYIHVHHVIPLSKIKNGYVVDPVKDLRPVCPNCHAVIHLRRDPYTVDEVKALIRTAS